MGQYVPLLLGGKFHRAENAFWDDRRCNYLQGEQDPLDAAVNKLLTSAAKRAGEGDAVRVRA